MSDSEESRKVKSDCTRGRDPSINDRNSVSFGRRVSSRASDSTITSQTSSQAAETRYSGPNPQSSRGSFHKFESGNKDDDKPKTIINRHLSSTQNQQLRHRSSLPSTSAANSDAHVNRAKSVAYESPSVSNAQAASTYSSGSFTQRPSVIKKYLDNSSGSDEDLNLEARRIMRQRKKEQERLERLGPMIPLDQSDFTADDSATSSASSEEYKVTTLFSAIALRTKRAETELIVPHMAIVSELFQQEQAKNNHPGSIESDPTTSQIKSALADDVRQACRKSVVNFGIVEERQFSDPESNESMTSETPHDYPI